MQMTNCRLLARHTFISAFRNRAVLVLTGTIVLLMAYAAISGYATWHTQTNNREHYQQEVRKHWEEMPDKHPHRMAHYGYIAFRTKHALSFFDFGLESYTGNAVFLEAHRQNTVNFSEAGFSTGLLRFGEISMAMVLQLLIPLLLFFAGFGVVAADRQNGTLKILISQGATWQTILLGRAGGLLLLGGVVFLPAIALLIAFYPGAGKSSYGIDWLRIVLIIASYSMFFCIHAVTAVVVSALCKTARAALILLTGWWLVLAVILPRAAQAMGNYLYPSPSKVAFETAVENDLVQQGDSHDPDDPYYKALKDSVLKAYNVESVEQLPFNYSGFQMKEGERISSEIYNRHLAALLQRYERQNRLARITACFNPFSAMRHLSMAVSGTDFQAYMRFQQQAEEYRYRLAQHMNELQIRLIPNKREGDKPNQISREHWKAFPDFQYKAMSLSEVLTYEVLSISTLLGWLVVLLMLVFILSKKLNAL